MIFSDEILAISCSKCNVVLYETYLPIITVFACNHQVKKVLISAKQNVFSLFHTLTPVPISLSHTVGLQQPKMFVKFCDWDSP